MASVVLEKIGNKPDGLSLPADTLINFKYQVKSSTFEIPLPDYYVTGLKFSEPIPVTPQDLQNLPDEIEIERQGSCNECGYCCGYMGANDFTEEACVHLIRTGNRKGECGIYETLADWCETCGDSHASCIPPPHQPYPLDICNYKWIVITPGLPITGKEVSRMYWIPKWKTDFQGCWIR